MSRLSFDDLGLFNAAFELRFDESYRLWDRAGDLWSETLGAFPELKRQHAEPNRVVFASIGTPVQRELTVELNRLVIVEHGPDKQLKHFAETVNRFAGIAVALLKIDQYHRTGLRMMFREELPSAEEAAERFFSTGLLQRTSYPEKLFGISAASVQPEFAFRREDSKNGFSIRLKAETQKIEINPVPGWPELDLPISKTKHWIVLDVDCYIQSSIPADALAFNDWILQTAHIVRRDCDQLLSGE
jgi:hypothetical protein